MPDALLDLPDGYDQESQTIVGLMAAALDDQSERLLLTTVGLTVQHLEWQERGGRNTVGMLMAHIAAVEVDWLYGLCRGVKYYDQLSVGTLATDELRLATERRLNEYLGIGPDGVMPLNGIHPPGLKGLDLESYRGLLARARSATHRLLQTWDDEYVKKKFTVFEGTKLEGNFTRRWVLYHLLEHFASHFGQINSLLHCMRDNGLWNSSQSSDG